MAASTTMAAAMNPLDNKGPISIVVGSALLFINIVAIGARVYSQAKVAKNFQINDVFMITVLGVYTALLAFLILGVENGIGKHTTVVILGGGADELSTALKYVFFLEIFYVVLTSIMKASLAISLYQWSKSRTHVYILGTAIVIDTAIGTVVSIYTLIQCKPISYNWNRLNPAAKGSCRDPNEIIKLGFALCAVTVFLDMLFLILPFFMMKASSTSPTVRKYIYSLLGLGVLASFANFIRIAALAKLGTYKDPLFDASDVFLWSFVEVSFGITVAGLLKLSPLLARYGVKGFAQSDATFSKMDDDDMPLKNYEIGKPMGLESTTTSF